MFCLGPQKSVGVICFGLECSLQRETQITTFPHRLQCLSRTSISDESTGFPRPPSLFITVHIGLSYPITHCLYKVIKVHIGISYLVTGCLYSVIKVHIETPLPGNKLSILCYKGAHRAPLPGNTLSI